METTDITSSYGSTENLNLKSPFEESPTYPHVLDRTDLQPISSSVSMSERIQKQPKKSEGADTEEILEWWIGTVLEVHEKEGYFTAHLKDMKYVENIAEFDISTEIKQDVFPGARFVFSVFTRYGQGSPETSNRVEFIPPHIWTKEEKEEAKEIYGKLFPEGPS